MNSDFAVPLILVLVLVACPAVRLLPPLSRSSARRWAARQRLPLRPQDAERITHHRARRSLSFALGALAGLLLTLPARTVIPALAVPPLRDWVWLVLAILGGAVAVAGQGLRVSRLPSGPGVWVAHSSAPRLTDYISVRVLRTTRVLIAVSALAALVSAWLPVWRGNGFGPEESGPVWVGLVVLLAGWAFAELAGRHISGRPQPGVDGLDLAWNDALRSEQVRDAFSIPTSLSLMAAALAAQPTQTGYPRPAWTDLVTTGVLAAMLVVLVTAVVVAAASLIPVTSRRRRSAVLTTAREG